MCCFLSLLSPLFLMSSCQEQEWQATPRIEIIEMGCLHRISSISFSTPSFAMDRLLALWPLLLLVSLVTCKVWSFDLYPKKLPCNMVYILTQNSIKHPCSTRDLGPHVLLSLFLADSLECGGQLCNPGNISLFPSFTFLLSTQDHQVPVH